MFMVTGEVIHVFSSVSPARQMLQNLMVQQLAVQAPLPIFWARSALPRGGAEGQFEIGFVHTMFTILFGHSLS